MEYKTLQKVPYYKISDSGVVMNQTTGHVMYQNVNENGYKTVNLKNNKGYRRNYLVHRLVAECFHECENPHEMIVDHKNSKKWDNRKENLEWVSIGENNFRHMRRDGRLVRVFVYDLDGNFIQEHESIRSAAKELELNESSIGDCLSGRYKQHKGYRFNKNKLKSLPKLKEAIGKADTSVIYSIVEKFVQTNKKINVNILSKELGVTRQTISRNITPEIKQLMKEHNSSL